jgi:hypothetical protein
MANISELLFQIENILGSSISPSLTASSDSSDIFEAYVFSLLIKAAKTEGALVTYRDVKGNTPSTFVFRTSPGYIFSTVQPYTHAVILFAGKPSLEAHVGVRVVGKSNVLHECDVAVIEQTEAETCRRNLVPPRSSKVLIAVECKFYSTPLQLSLARAFIGLTSDLSAKNSLFATNTVSDSLEKLLSGRKHEWEHNLAPRSLVQVDRLRGKFQTAFQHFKATT